MNILCVVAHPDDEVLGCGGTLAKHAEADDDVYAISIVRRNLDDQFEAAAKVLGIGGYTENFPDQKLDIVAFTDIVDIIENRAAFDYDIVYTHNPDDLNLDHAIVARAVLTAFRPHVSQAAILAFETISSTEWGVEPFAPNHFEVLTGAHMDRKIDALNCYTGEVREAPHPRNAAGVFTQAGFRGAQCGNLYAEAFRVLRSIG